MINPVTGGAQPEAEIRAHLGRLRVWAEAYNTLDRDTGGLYKVCQDIVALENVLAADRGARDSVEAEWQFLRRNPQVRFNEGVPTWVHYELVDDEWQAMQYEVHVTLSAPRAARVEDL